MNQTKNLSDTGAYQSKVKKGEKYTVTFGDDFLSSKPELIQENTTVFIILFMLLIRLKC
jgi:hypothetical protein